MNPTIFLILAGLGLSFDVLSIAVAQGSVLGNVVAKKMVLMCLIVCGWQAIACGMGYCLSIPIAIETLTPEAQGLWSLIAAVIFIAEGGIKLYIIHHKKEVEEERQEINFGKICGIAASTSIYTFFAGFACGVLMVSTVGLGIMICVLTIVLVIIGVYVGYNNGDLHKGVYRSGGIVLIIAGALVIINYATHLVV